jgi:hypothetical protein
VLCSVNEAILDIFAKQYFQQNTAKFGDTTTFAGQDVTYAASAPPTFSLGTGATGNVTVTFSSVSVTPAGAAAVTLGATLTGTIGLAAGVLALSGVTSVITGAGDWLDGKIGKFVAAQIQKRYESEVTALPLPVFSDVLDSDFTIALQNATITDGVMNVTASLAYGANSTAGPTPQAVVTGNGSPIAAVMINAAGMNTALLSQQSTFPIQQPFSQNETLLGTGYGVKGTAYVQFPSIVIGDSTAEVDSRVTIDAEIGVEAVGSWTWVPIQIQAYAAMTVVPVFPTLDKAVLEVTAVSVSVAKLPFPPDVPTELANAINALLASEVSSKVTSAAVGKTFPLMTFPSSVSGASSPVHVSSLFFRQGDAVCFIE